MRPHEPLPNRTTVVSTLNIWVSFDVITHSSRWSLHCVAMDMTITWCRRQMGFGVHPIPGMETALSARLPRISFCFFLSFLGTHSRRSSTMSVFDKNRFDLPRLLVFLRVVYPKVADVSIALRSIFLRQLHVEEDSHTDVAVPPTIADIRAGRDRALEKAVELVKGQR